MSGVPGELDLGFLSLPGWFSPLDAKMFLLADAAQRSSGVEGDLLEIGAHAVGQPSGIIRERQREGIEGQIGRPLQGPRADCSTTGNRTSHRA